MVKKAAKLVTDHPVMHAGLVHEQPLKVVRGPQVPPPTEEAIGNSQPDLKIKESDAVDSTVGYRNGPNGTIETAIFTIGYLPKGWNDNPVNCKNYVGKDGTGTGHMDYVKVKLDI